jgi:hypothetical protein
MKRFFLITMFALAMVACNSKGETPAVVDQPVTVATEIVPAAATEVIPCAAPGPDAGGKVATEVIADSVAK